MGAQGCIVDGQHEVFVSVLVDVQNVHIEGLFRVVVDLHVAAGVRFHFLSDGLSGETGDQFEAYVKVADDVCLFLHDGFFDGLRVVFVLHVGEFVQQERVGSRGTVGGCCRLHVGTGV